MELEQKLVHIKLVSAEPSRERTAADYTCSRALRGHNVTNVAWYTLLIAELKKLRQESRKLEASLGYRASLKPACLYAETCLKKTDWSLESWLSSLEHLLPPQRTRFHF